MAGARALAGALLAALVVGASPAVSADGVCGGDDPAASVAACSRVIEAVGEGETGVLVDALLARAAALMGLRDYAAAAGDAERAMALAPDEARVHAARGNIHYEAKEYDRAIVAYGRAVARDPDYGLAYAGRGGARTYEGDIAGALADFEAALKAGYDTAWTYNGRGNARRSAGDLDGAYADYLHAAELDPGKVDAHLNIGDVRFIRADYEGALRAYQTAVDLDPDDWTDAVTGATRLGDTLARLGRIDEAVAAWELSFARGGPVHVAGAQRHLARHGHYDGPIDGALGPAMRAALARCAGDREC